VTVDLEALVESLVREAGLDAGPQPGGPASGAPTLGGLRLAVVAVGWATVELDRAAVAVRRSADPAAGDATIGESSSASARDELLGAEARLVSRPFERPGLVLLEPSTEGRLAASLARRGEGPAALYLVPVGVTLRAGVERLAATGIRTRLGRGPFGDAALVLGRTPGSPQLILVAVPSEP
jgi:hypothetical protein